MPHAVPHDLAAATGAILAQLERHQAQAVFFVVGRMIEDHTEVVRTIAAAGHEVGLHGYEHVNLSHLDADALAVLEKNIARVSALLEDVTGARPRGFRAPYLMWPRYFRHDLYSMLGEQGFQWVSNLPVRNPADLLRPRSGRFRVSGAWRGHGGKLRLDDSRILLALVNNSLVRHGTFRKPAFRAAALAARQPGTVPARRAHRGPRPDTVRQ